MLANKIPTSVMLLRFYCFSRRRQTGGEREKKNSTESLEGFRKFEESNNPRDKWNERELDKKFKVKKWLGILSAEPKQEIS